MKEHVATAAQAGNSEHAELVGPTGADDSTFVSADKAPKLLVHITNCLPHHYCDRRVRFAGSDPQPDT